ncbi:MAG: formylglycine-generating enzyme family protein [Elusimicrobiota bacterium]
MRFLLAASFLFVGAAAAVAAGDKSGIIWVSLPGGNFTMGSERWPDAKPLHQVSVKPFQIAKTPVTNKQYRACVDAGACAALAVKCATAAFTGDDQPVVCVTWGQAAAFSRWAGGRLPSEAEWEYAARGAGRTRAVPWGDEPATCARAVLDEGGYGCGRKTSWPVCSKPLGNTAQGLCDMAGGVYEWLEDAYHESYDRAPTDGGAWEAPRAKHRVVRGGSWSRKADYLFSSLRAAAVPGNANVTLGFRPAR